MLALCAREEELRMAYRLGSIYLYKGTWFLKYRTEESKDGTAHRVHKTVRLRPQQRFCQ